MFAEILYDNDSSGAAAVWSLGRFATILAKQGSTMRIFIAESDRELSVSLQTRLQQESDMAVVGLAIHSRGLFTQVAASQPDVVVLDWQLPDRPAAGILADLYTLERRPSVIVISSQPETEKEAKVAGADAFVTKTASADQLVAILRGVQDGGLAP